MNHVITKIDISVLCTVHGVYYRKTINNSLIIDTVHVLIQYCIMYDVNTCCGAHLSFQRVPTTCFHKELRNIVKNNLL